MNALNRKARGDLTKHRTRTLLAAGTLAIAITSLGLLAVPGLLNAAMNRQVQQSRLNDVAIPTRVLDLTPAQPPPSATSDKTARHHAADSRANQVTEGQVR